MDYSTETMGAHTHTSVKSQTRQSTILSKGTAAFLAKRKSTQVPAESSLSFKLGFDVIGKILRVNKKKTDDILPNRIHRAKIKYKPPEY